MPAHLYLTGNGGMQCCAVLLPLDGNTCCCAAGASSAAAADGQQASQDKLRMQIDKSRVVFGVADSAQMLQYGQCYFQPTLDNIPHVFSETYILVVSMLIAICQIVHQVL